MTHRVNSLDVFTNHWNKRFLAEHIMIGQWRGMQRTNSQYGFTGLPVAFSGFREFTDVSYSDNILYLYCTKENIL